MFCSTCNAEVMHDPIPEDEAHCECEKPAAWAGPHGYVGTVPFRGVSFWKRCPCPCHGPAWLTESDADVPDVIEEPSIHD